MADASKTDQRAILVSDPELTYADSFSASLSSITQAGPKPGIPEAQGDTEMVLVTTGEQDTTADLQIIAQRAGMPRPGGAGFRWRYSTDASTSWRGWDPPQGITGFEYIDYSTTANNWLSPHVIRRLDDGLLAVVTRTLGSMTVSSWRKAYTATAWSQTVVSAATITGNPFPTVCQLPSGKMLCAYIVPTGDPNLNDVAVSSSDDNGATWDVYSAGTLSDLIDTTAWTVTRMRIAYSGSQVLLVVAMQSGGFDRLVQYASSDLATSFTYVSTSEGTTYSRAYPDIVVDGGRFLVAYLRCLQSGAASAADLRPHVKTLGTAFANLNSAEERIAAQAANPMEWGTVAAGVFTSGDLAAWSDEDGTLWMTGRDHDAVGGAFQEWHTQRSADNGQSWAAIGWGSDPAYGCPWWYTLSAGDGPRDVTACAQAGRVVVVCRHTSDGSTTDPSLGAIYLGGYSSVTLPNKDDEPTSAVDRVAWEKTWVPYDVPENIHASVTYVAGGAPTISLTSTGMRYQGGIAQAAEWNQSPVSTEAQGLIALMEVDVATDTATGGAAIQLVLSDGATYGYSVRCRVGPAVIEVTDEYNGSAVVDSVVTTDGTTGVQVLMALHDGIVSAWYRLSAPGIPTSRRWTAVASIESVTDDGGAGAPTNVVTLRALLGTNSDHRYKLWCWTYGAYTGDSFAGTFVNPTSLLPRSVPTTPMYVDGGTRIHAVDGPAAVGDEWHIATRHEHGIENIFPEVSPSPRRGWRSVNDDVQQDIVVEYPGGLATDFALLGGSLGLYLGEINFRTATFSGYDTDTAGWVTLADLDTSTGQTGLSYRRYGDRVQPNATQAGTPSTQWYTYHILHNSYIRLTDTTPVGGGDPISVVRKILYNSEGAWRQDNGTTKVARLILAGTAGSDGDGTSVGDTAAIWSKDALIIVNNPAQYARYRLRIPVQSTYEGDFRIGVMMIGHVAVLARQYSWGRIVGSEHNTELTTGRSGTRRARNLGPMRRTAEMAWTDGVDSSTLWASTPTPDHVTAYTGSTEPIAAPADTAHLVYGLVEALRGSNSPIVVVPRFTRQANATTDVQVLNRHGMLYGRIVTDPRLETILGDELENPGEVVQLATITVEEEV